MTTPAEAALAALKLKRRPLWSEAQFFNFTPAIGFNFSHTHREKNGNANTNTNSGQPKTIFWPPPYSLAGD